jgi:DNA end-binding protein Ku
MGRPYWSGQVLISLVSFGVSLYVATEAKSNISFHQISRSTGERMRHQKVLQSAVNSGEIDSGDVVQKDEIVKGYEYTKGHTSSSNPVNWMTFVCRPSTQLRFSIHRPE